MPVYRFSPRAPLLFREGRPFGGDAAAQTFPFPRPDTMAGALRAAWVSMRREAGESGELWNQVSQVEVAGPLLVRTRLDGRVSEPLFPAPADFRTYHSEYGGPYPRIAPLVVKHLNKGEGMDEMADNGLLPLAPWLAHPEDAFAKLTSGPPFWPLEALVEWLSLPDGGGSRNAQETAFESLLESDPLPLVRRTHLSIDPATRSAEDGRFFITESVDFGPRRPANESEFWEHGLLARCSELPPDGLRRLGGRSRLAMLQRQAESVWPDACPSRLGRALAGVRGIRLMLLTPALFEQGWRPGWLGETKKGWQGSPPGFDDLVLQLRAVSLSGWQPASAWDGERGRPGRLKRLVPAGTVYWFSVLAGHHRLPELWFSHISDGQPERRDGFGLAAPGVWEGAHAP